MTAPTQPNMKRPGFAIQQYHDIEPIYKKLYGLASSPICDIDRTEMDNYLKLLNQKCSQSKAVVTKAMEFIPGGVQHNLAFKLPLPYGIQKSRRCLSI